jgi:uncharacterized membrane protein
MSLRWRSLAASSLGGMLAAVGALLLFARGIAEENGVVAVASPASIDTAAFVGGVVGAGIGGAFARLKPTWPVSPALVGLGVSLFFGRLFLLRPSLLALPVCATAGAYLVARARKNFGQPEQQKSALLSFREAIVLSEPRAFHLLGAGMVAVVGAVLYSIYAVERHVRFGSGSWDLGCYLHNAWLFAHGDAFSLQAKSSVLGDVFFWGGSNHFMPSLVLTAPLSLVMEQLDTTSLLVVAQAIIVAAAALPLAALARHKGLGPWTTTALAASFLFAVPTQSFLLFDVHELAPVPLLIFFVVWLVRSSGPSLGRVSLAVVSLLVVAGCKESAILYAAAVGAFIAVYVPSWRLLGVVVVVAGIAWFFVVTALLQPALLEPGGTMLHVARFVRVDGGPAPSGLGAVLWSWVSHPGQALARLVTPDVKLTTMGTTVMSLGGLSLWSGEGFLLSLPSLVERFLSEKREMWGLGFHYGLVITTALTVGAIDVLSTMRRRFAHAVGFDAGAAVFVAVSLVGSWATSPVPPEFATFEKPYFATVDEVARYRRALANIDDDDAVVAQNHFLPHLALRRHIWLPEERFVERADVVLLDSRASPWPHTPQHVQRLLARLRVDPRFRAVWHEHSTWVFRRR